MIQQLATLATAIALAGADDAHLKLPPPPAPSVPLQVPADVTIMSSRNFHIPIHLGEQSKDKIKHIRLLSSVDGGKSWKVVDSVALGERDFRVSSPCDGVYWFANQIVLQDGTKVPRKKGIAPELKMFVNSQGKPITRDVQQGLENEVRELRKKVAGLERRLTELEAKNKQSEDRAQATSGK